VFGELSKGLDVTKGLKKVRILQLLKLSYSKSTHISIRGIAETSAVTGTH
jgi:hypothetical protein